MKVLEIWKAFNKTAKISIIVLGLLFVGSFAMAFIKEGQIDRWRKGYEAYRDTAQAAVEWGRLQALRADSAVQVSDSSKAVADELREENKAIKRRTEEAERRSRRLAAANDSLFAEVSEGATTVEEAVENTPEEAHPWVRLSFSLYEENDALKEEIELWKMQVDNLEGENTALRQSIVSLESAVVFQEERADSLETIIVNLPEGPPSEKLLGIIPLPSRKASLIVGFIGGVVTTSAILSQL